MQPIGVFDSGMGGLTVLRALRAQLPAHSFVYLGDTARLPYGTKSADTVRRYATQAADILLQHNVGMIVIACNTASAVAIDGLRAAFAPVPVVGVVEPGAAAVAQAIDAQAARVLVLATESTVSGGAYYRQILARAPRSRVWSRAAPLLVALAEEGRTDDELATLVLGDYLKGFTDPVPDVVLLGCTHFPVFRTALQRLLPHTQILDSAATTASAVKAQLDGVAGDSAGLRFLATDGLARFQRVGQVFFGAPLTDARLVDL